jgi:hypothetical protein
MMQLNSRISTDGEEAEAKSQVQVSLLLVPVLHSRLHGLTGSSRW